jgi:hypothetical protein
VRGKLRPRFRAYLQVIVGAKHGTSVLRPYIVRESLLPRPDIFPTDHTPRIQAGGYPDGSLARRRISSALRLSRS